LPVSAAQAATWWAVSVTFSDRMYDESVLLSTGSEPNQKYFLE